MDKYYDQIQGEVFDVATRLEGIAFLIYNFRQEGHGDRDEQAMHGVGMILEDLAKKAHEASDKLDLANRRRARPEVG